MGVFFMGQAMYFDRYSAVGDIMVLGFGLLIFVLLFFSYTNKTKAYLIYMNSLVYVVLAALCNMIYHTIYSRTTNGDYVIVYVLRVMYHALLFSTLLLFVVYIVTLQRLEKDRTIPVMSVSVLVYLSIIIVDIVTSVRGTGFRLDRRGRAISGINIFLIGYLLFIVIICYLMIRYRNRIYRKVMYGFYGSMAIAFLILYMQGRHGNTAFTTASFLFPIIAMLYLVHSNPYNIELGTIDVRALEDMVRYNYEHKHELIFISLYLPDFDTEGKSMTMELQDMIRKFSAIYFREANLFQVSNGRMILFTRKDFNSEYEKKFEEILARFHEEYKRFRYDYKIVAGVSIDAISEKNDYVRFIKSIERSHEVNSVHFVQPEDVTAYEKINYILSELSDIHKKKDPDDKRVCVYCQPVLNIETGKYDTAEALMRLSLPKYDLVFPDEFIPLAENNGYIHILTEIILHKTCMTLKKLLNEGYEINRISVNVSSTELKEENFTEDISSIIAESGIPFEKIAIEITETRNEGDFVLIKEKIEELKAKGIKIYLDDFGTGYSNMERILALPFDIIKFDRSLVNISQQDERSEKMVESLARMFSELTYYVLYEGVETEHDEKQCKDMSASYLQGYRYSRPIPILEMRQFFSK